MARPHWLAAGGKSWSPAAVLSFDTETRLEDRNGQEVLTLRCWDARLRLRGEAARHGDVTDDQGGEQAIELVQYIEAAAKVTGEVWCFAHNVGFDLTVTSLPMVMAERGWESQFVSIGDEVCVFVLKRLKETVVVTDSWSWLRCSLESIAPSVGMRKTRLPDEDDDLADWHHRCAHDVRILDALLADLLDWWDRAGCGKFGVTGASCGWRAMRTRIPEKSILVGSEDPRSGLEREAIYGGRREVFRVGRIRGHWVEDWDLVAAHLSTVAQFPMPSRPVDASRLSPPPDLLCPPAGLGAIVRCKITTEVPVAPVRVCGEVWWPTGQFVTVLTTPEIDAVLELGAHVEALEGQFYRLDDSLKEWARWCQRVQSGEEPGTPPIVRRVAKCWGRAVPGRFALRTSQLIGERPAQHLGWALETGHDLDTGDELEVLTYGGVERTYRKDQPGADSSPVVLAFVEGYVRAAMARTLQARGADKVLQVNTDGWWEIRPGRESGEAAGAVPLPYMGVRKAVSRDVVVLGPNHTDSRGDRRLAGIPKTADRRLDGTYVWQDWPGLRWQLQFSRPGEYMRPGRKMQLAEHYCRRWVLRDGATVPVACVLKPDGETVLCSWSETPGRPAGAELAPYQVQWLSDLLALEPS